MPAIRTIADAERAGWETIRATCACGRVGAIPLRFARKMTATRDLRDLARALVCSVCKEPAADVRLVWSDYVTVAALADVVEGRRGT